MPGWSLVVDLVRATVFAVAHLCGNSVGSGILAVSVLVRVALLPVTLRAARRAMAHQARLVELKPALDRLRALHGDDRARLAEATLQLHRDERIEVLPPGMLRSALIQMPVGAAMYQAFARGLGPRLGFLWVGDLARPDVALATIAALLAAAAAAIGATPASRAGILISGALTLLLAWRLSASVALYWVASNGVGVVQALLLRPASGRGRA